MVKNPHDEQDNETIWCIRKRDLEDQPQRAAMERDTCPTAQRKAIW